jgi:outer membrane protein
VTAAGALAQTAPAPNKLTLHDALTRAMEVNEQLERSREEIGVAQANQRYIFSQVLPRVNVSGSTTKNSTEVSFGSGSDSRVILPGTDWNYRAVLTQPIYAGNRDRRAYEQAKITVRNAEEGVRGTEDAVLLRVASNYLAIVDADRSIDVEKRNISLSEKRREQATAFYQAGETTKVDVLRAETSIKAAQRALAVAQQSRATAEGRLRADLDLSGPIEVTDPGHVLPPLPDETTLMARAQSDRPDITTAVNNLRAADLEIKKQRGFWFPVVTFEAGYLDQKAAFPAARYGYGRLNFNIPVWQSGEVQARVAGAKERELQAQSTLDEAKIAAREDVHRAIVDLQAAATSLTLANDQLSAAEAEYNQVFELYRAQESTSLDVATSEQSLAEARRAVATETLNRDLAELRVWYAAGALKEAVGIATARTIAQAGAPDASQGSGVVHDSTRALAQPLDSVAPHPDIPATSAATRAAASTEPGVNH